MGLPPIFLVKKGGPKNFKAQKGALKIVYTKMFLHQAPPYKCL